MTPEGGGGKENGCREAMLSCITDHIKKQVWECAAGHIDGKGLEDEPDLTIMAKHLKRLHKQGDSKTASTLMTIASGGI